MSHDPQVRALLRHLRSHFTLTLRSDLGGDPRAFDAPYILDPASNRIVLSLALHPHPSEGVLFIPDDGWDALELLVELAPLSPPDSPASDRFRAAHTGGARARLCSARVLSAKLRGVVASGDDLPLTFAWLDREPELRRLLNADRARLALRASDALAAPAPECLTLSLDPDGILFRTRTGLTRLAFPSPCDTFDAADAAVRALLQDAPA